MMEDDLWWKRLMMEDDLWWKTTYDDDEEVCDDDVVHDANDNDGNDDLQWTEILHWSSIPELGISSFLAWRRMWKANFKPLSHHHNVTFQQKWIDNFINDHKWSVSRLNPIFWGKGQPPHNQRYHNIYDHHHPVQTSLSSGATSPKSFSSPDTREISHDLIFQASVRQSLLKRSRRYLPEKNVRMIIK